MIKRRGQEEIIGFALIIILVAIILVVILGFSLRSKGKEAVESYEAESFVQAFLQYTTECSNGLEYLSIQKLIFECESESLCQSGEKTCGILESNLRAIVEKSWKVGEETPVKGYEIKIETEEGEVLPAIKQGEETKNSEGSMQSFTRNNVDYYITFKVYY